MAHGPAYERRCTARDRDQYREDQERTRSVALMLIFQPQWLCLPCPRLKLTTIGRWSTLQRSLFQNEHPSILLSFYMNFAHKYVIFMKGDTLAFGNLTRPHRGRLIW